MLDLFSSIAASARNPHSLHAMLIHWPIVMSVVGLVLLFVLAAGRGRWHGLRWATVAAYVLGVGMAFWAMEAGEEAEEHVEHAVQLSPEAHEHLETHEDMGKVVWIFLLVTAGCTALSALPQKPVRIAALCLALAAGIATMGWIVVTADHGGTLVYRFGVGVPQTQHNMPVDQTIHPIAATREHRDRRDHD